MDGLEKCWEGRFVMGSGDLQPCSVGIGSDQGHWGPAGAPSHLSWAAL